MYCRTCGVKSEEGSRFCDFCGTQLIMTGEGNPAHAPNHAKPNRRDDDTEIVNQEDHVYDRDEDLHRYPHVPDVMYESSHHNSMGTYAYSSENHVDDQGEFQDQIHKGGTYRENNREKKHFAIFVFLACTLVIALGFGILFFFVGDGFSRNDGEQSNVAEVNDDSDVTACESDLGVDLELTTEETIDSPVAVEEERSDEPEDTPAVEDEDDLQDSEDEDSILVGLWEGSFITRGGTAFDLIIGIDANNRVTATYFQADERETVFARYYGVAQRSGEDGIIIEYTSSSIRPPGWDESGITLFGIISNNTISGFFEFEEEQTGTAILRMETLATGVEGEQLYRIRLTWEDATSQVGAFTNLSNAINATPQGYSVFDGQGNVVFTRR